MIATAVQRRDRNLRVLLGQLGEHFIELGEEALASIEAEDYRAYGYADAEDYFVTSLGVEYRTVQKWIAVAQGLRRLPPAEEAKVRKQLADLGPGKAAVLAPVIGMMQTLGQGDNPPEEVPMWTPLLEAAPLLTEAALQDRVSEARGLTTRERTDGKRGDRFLSVLIAHMPDAASKAEVHLVFDALKELDPSGTRVGHFLRLIQEAKVGILQLLVGQRRRMGG
jgi:hypothetical protein